MHVGKVIGRLGPKTQNWGNAGGGKSELTPQDIAAGLAFVPAGLGRELMQYLWGQDSSIAGRDRVSALMMRRLHEEWRQREEAQLNAMLMVSTPEVPRGKAAKAYDEAHARRWPAWVKVERGVLVRVDGYDNVHKAVLLEITSTPAAPDVAEGRRFSDRARARLVGKNQMSYRAKWADVYGWLINTCEEEMHMARKALSRAIF